MKNGTERKKTYRIATAADNLAYQEFVFSYLSFSSDPTATYTDALGQTVKRPKRTSYLRCMRQKKRHHNEGLFFIVYWENATKNIV